MSKEKILSSIIVDRERPHLETSIFVLNSISRNAAFSQEKAVNLNTPLRVSILTIALQLKIAADIELEIAARN